MQEIYGMPLLKFGSGSELVLTFKGAETFARTTAKVLPVQKKLKIRAWKLNFTFICKLLSLILSFSNPYHCGEVMDQLRFLFFNPYAGEESTLEYVHSFSSCHL